MCEKRERDRTRGSVVEIEIKEGMKVKRGKGRKVRMKEDRKEGIKEEWRKRRK